MTHHDAPGAWVKLPDPELLKPVMKGHPYDFGFLPAMTRLISAHPGIAPFFRDLFARLMFGPGALSRQEREMVAGVAAAAQDCRY